MTILSSHLHVSSFLQSFPITILKTLLSHDWYTTFQSRRSWFDHFSNISRALQTMKPQHYEIFHSLHVNSRLFGPNICLGTLHECNLPQNVSFHFYSIKFYNEVHTSVVDPLSASPSVLDVLKGAITYFYTHSTHTPPPQTSPTMTF